MHFEEHRKTWQRWKVLSVSRLQCYCHSLIICKGTFRPDKYTLLLERNLWPQDAVSVMVGSGCLVHGRFISEHSSAQCLQSPCSSSCRFEARASKAGGDHRQGISTPQVSSPCTVTTAWVWAVQLIHRQPTRPPLPASRMLRGHRSYKGFWSLSRSFFCVCLFIWLRWVLAGAHVIFDLVAACRTISYGMSERS